ncbi:TonB family protein [Flammeovirga yaeyamensis]|uniref:TonB family protein n=1 Tax=Flammeovirga yaeyamensis TaxID=367791 RepID=A0AAX1N3D7_9BACT|nr:energy transducer TonB [Flammeovirga yaeyamensis]MBB3700641.1 protein TonB [Flammeovirga yaeyamensis]NMF37757.1 energy transducer TonB [Flammeovirga yaeyamensis]QWG02065.1 TonB family protein [Flammeovirga yaeyamensis]
MIEILKTIGLEGVLIAFVVTLIGMIQVFRVVIRRREERPPRIDQDELIKKYDNVNLSKFTNFFRLIGVSMAMITVFAAFETPTSNTVLMNLDDYERMDPSEYDSIVDIDIIKPKVQPKKIFIPEKIEVVDNNEDLPDIDIDIQEFDTDTEIEVIEDDYTDEPDEEVTDYIHDVVQKKAEFRGGVGKFYKFLSKSIKYPKQAMRMGVEGKVYVQFVVGKDGSLTDFKVVKGLGAGLDEEALRVLKMSPKWTPAEQRGRIVRQRMVIPISFKIN